MRKLSLKNIEKALINKCYLHNFTCQSVECQLLTNLSNKKISLKKHV